MDNNLNIVEIMKKVRKQAELHFAEHGDALDSYTVRQADASERTSDAGITPSSTHSELTLPKPEAVLKRHWQGNHFHCRQFVYLPIDSFLQAAYVALLGRPADEEGMASYGKYLRNGGSKLSVLAELRYSEEGRRRGVALEGMPLVFRRHLLLKQLGYIGRLLRKFCDPFDRLYLAFTGESGLELAQRLDEKNQQYQREFAGQLEKVFHQQQTQLSALQQELTRFSSRSERDCAASRENISTLQADVQRLSLAQASLKEASSEHEHYHRAITNELAGIRQQLVQTQAMLADNATPASYTELKDSHVNDDLASQAEPAEYIDDRLLNAYYVAFEEACRGSRSEIHQSLQQYLPFYEQLARQKSLQELPVLDLGCGRGEWLELLAEHGWQGIGVDSNEIMVKVCAEFGVNAKRQGALEALLACEDASLASISGFHIIEHLPFPYLYALMREAIRCLKAGGILLFETPNPENVLVGSHTFYHDFSHRNPVTPTSIQFMAQYFGFNEITIIRSHPYPESARVPGSDPLTERVNGHLTGPQDFAMIAKKPHIDRTGELFD